MSINKSTVRELTLLFRSIPSPIMSVFVVSVVVMNLLANKSVSLPFDWLEGERNGSPSTAE